MAVQIPIVSQFVDDGIKAAQREFLKISRAVKDAEGAMGKLKAGGTAAFDALAKNAGKFAAAATAMAATFAVKAVFGAQQLALAAGKLADATGLTVEEASRLKEVAGDIGIDQGILEASIGKMNKALGTSPKLFKELGVEIAYAKDGSVDANKTFLNVVDRLNSIKDPAERARVASQLLGKGWQSMSELIGQGSDKLKKSLDQVSGAKVVNEAELAKARKLRDNLDNLKDVGEDLAQTVGSDLLPILVDLAEVMLSVYEAGKKVADALTIMPDILDKKVVKEFIATVEASKALENAWKSGYQTMVEAGRQSRIFDGDLAQLEDGTYDLNIAWQRLLGNLDRDAMFRNAIEQVKSLEEAAAAAFGDPTKYNAFRNEMDRTYQTVAALLQTVQASNAEQNQIKLMVDTGQVERAIRLLQIMNLRPGTTLGQAAQHIAETNAFLGTLGIPGRAMGGTVSAGGTYLVGERGPELLTVGAGGGHVSPMGAGGNTINLTVNALDPNQAATAVVKALQSYVRSNGPVPVNTRAM
jgi:hypothetical protein